MANPGSVGIRQAESKKGTRADTQSSSSSSSISTGGVPTGNRAKNSDIWTLDEVPEEGQEGVGDAYDDPRPQPKYDIKFKQAITPEDMFLGMSGKTPASSSCDELVVSIELPDTSMKDVELDVTRETLDLRAPNYRLFIYLPHNVSLSLTHIHSLMIYTH